MGVFAMTSVCIRDIRKHSLGFGGKAAPGILISREGILYPHIIACTAPTSYSQGSKQGDDLAILVQCTSTGQRTTAGRPEEGER